MCSGKGALYPKGAHGFLVVRRAARTKIRLSALLVRTLRCCGTIVRVEAVVSPNIVYPEYCGRCNMFPNCCTIADLTWGRGCCAYSQHFMVRLTGRFRLNAVAPTKNQEKLFEHTPGRNNCVLERGRQNVARYRALTPITQRATVAVHCLLLFIDADFHHLISKINSF